MVRGILLSVLCGVLLLSACGKIELPEQESSSGELPSDSSDIDLDNVLTVAQLLSLSGNEQNAVYVKGYIVGYVAGTSLKYAKFSLPEGNENTNMLISDSPYEQDVKNCAAVILETGTYGYRSELNLYDHPDFFHQPILIYGRSEAYFGKTGIKKIFDYCWIAEDDPVEPPSEDNDFPEISDDIEYVPEGR